VTAWEDFDRVSGEPTTNATGHNTVSSAYVTQP
jgi:hypothetical protein